MFGNSHTVCLSAGNHFELDPIGQNTANSFPETAASVENNGFRNFQELSSAPAFPHGKIAIGKVQTYWVEYLIASFIGYLQILSQCFKS